VIPKQSDLSSAAVVALSDDLLPGWYDDWVLVEAEDWRQLGLHALEALAGRLTAAGCWGQAADAAWAAVRAERSEKAPMLFLSRSTWLRATSQKRCASSHYRALQHAALGLGPNGLALRSDVIS
jgi:SARP family transcriptional regulator, regulator of embCAB operon